MSNYENETCETCEEFSLPRMSSSSLGSCKLDEAEGDKTKKTKNKWARACSKWKKKKH